MNRPLSVALGAAFLLCGLPVQAQTRWNHAPVTYAVLGGTSSEVSVVREAAAAWQTALPAGWSLTQTPDIETCDIAVRIVDAATLRRAEGEIDPDSAFVRVMVRPATGNPPGIAHAVVWVRNDLTPALTRALIAHGLGHALGLAHGETADLMRPDPATFALSLPAGGLLSGRDTSALWALYGHG